MYLLTCGPRQVSHVKQVFCKLYIDEIFSLKGDNNAYNQTEHGVRKFYEAINLYSVGMLCYYVLD